MEFFKDEDNNLIWHNPNNELALDAVLNLLDSWDSLDLRKFVLKRKEEDKKTVFQKLKQLFNKKKVKVAKLGRQLDSIVYFQNSSYEYFKSELNFAFIRIKNRLTLAGVVLLESSTLGKSVQIGCIAVNPKLTKMGIGLRMINSITENIFNFCSSPNIKVITAVIDKDNYKSLKLFEKANFVQDEYPTLSKNFVEYSFVLLDEHEESLAK